MNRTILIFLVIIPVVFYSCRGMKQEADLIIYNAHIQTVDQHLTVTEAMAVKDGKILGTGTNDYIFQHYISDNRRDLKGKYIYPGFIDSHCHFIGYARTVKTMANLYGVKSQEEMIRILKQFHQDHPNSWLAGRGWDQNKWEIKEFPDKTLLDKEFPGVPVVLIRIDGHAVLVNEVAIRQLDLTVQNISNSKEAIIRDGNFTGIFFENEADRFKHAVPDPNPEVMADLLAEAEQDCFQLGLTTVADAGLSKEKVLFLDSLQKEGKLSMRIYAMLDPTEENFEHFVRKGPYQTDHLNVRSLKVYADGALGSRGACLLKPYSDAPNTSGIMLITPDKLREICNIAYQNGYQINTHCIGDSANRLVLNVYKEFLKGKNDRRWRIEHAQVVDPSDVPLFGQYSIIPAIQATHVTSDMGWADERLGKDRIKNGYIFKTLMQQNGWIPNGTDFPIEKINPFYTFYAAVSRKDLEGNPPGGFQMENALTPEEALKSLTIWAAKSLFEDEVKGSLEPGKFADFIVLKENLLSIPITAVPNIAVEETYLAGKPVYRAK